MTAIVCRNGVELLMEYLEGDLPAQVRADLEAHVLGCPRCVAFIESYRQTPEIMRDATSMEMPDDLADRMRKFLRERAGLRD